MSNLNLLGLQDECKTAIVSPLLTWKQNYKWYLRRPGSAIEHAVRQHPRTAKYEGATWPQRLRAETSRSSMPEGFSFALAHSWPKPTEEAGRMQLTARSIRPVGRGRRHSLGTVPCTERAAAAPVGARGESGTFGSPSSPPRGTEPLSVLPPRFEPKATSQLPSLTWTPWTPSLTWTEERLLNLLVSPLPQQTPSLRPRSSEQKPTMAQALPADEAPCTSLTNPTPQPLLAPPSHLPQDAQRPKHPEQLQLEQPQHSKPPDRHEQLQHEQPRYSQQPQQPQQTEQLQLQQQQQQQVKALVDAATEPLRAMSQGASAAADYRRVHSRPIAYQQSSHVDSPTAGPRIHARKPTGVAATPSPTAIQHWPDEARPTSSQERRPTMERERVPLRPTITRPPTIVREEASMTAKPEDVASEAQQAIRRSDNASGPPMAPTLASADATATSSRAARGLRNPPASAPRAPRSSSALMASHIPTSALAPCCTAPAGVPTAEYSCVGVEWTSTPA